MIVTIGIVVAVLAIAAVPEVHAGLEGTIPEATAYTTQRKLVRLSDGTLALAYVAQIAGTLHVQLAESRDGIEWASLGSPSPGNAPADRPSLAVDASDVLHLAWTEGEPLDRQVYYARYQTGGWSEVERVSETTGYSGFPSVAVDSRDRVHVAWYGFDGTYYQVYYRIRDASGWGSQLKVTSSFVDALNPAVALDGADTAHIVWYHLKARGTGYDVSYVSVPGGPTTLSDLSPSSENSFDPTIAIDRHGRVFVAWSSFPLASPEQPARIALTVLEGDHWSLPAAFTPPEFSAIHPSLAIDPGGVVFAFYEAGGKVEVQRQEGSAWSVAEPIPGNGTSSYPSARWSYYPYQQPLTDRVDVVWTEKSPEGSFAIRYGFEASSSTSVSPQGKALMDAYILSGLGLALAALVWFGVRRRRRGRWRA